MKMNTFAIKYFRTQDNRHITEKGRIDFTKNSASQCGKTRNSLSPK